MSTSIFDRPLVGVDGSEAGFEACRQALRLASAGAPIAAVAAVHLVDAVWTGFDAVRVTEELERSAHDALARAKEILGERAETKFVNGRVTPSILGELERRNATLAVVGSHGHHRATDIVLGGVSGDLLHTAPCSVLVTRPPRDQNLFPSAIVCGFDGSPEAERALVSARELAERFGATLRVITALRGKLVGLAPGVEWIEDHPVDALVAAAASADLVMLGSRGLHGLRALGSVSERVAHQSSCSVLVVRSRPAT